MVFECNSCGNSCWEDECEMSYKNGGSGVIVCPECDGGLSKVLGEVEESIFRVIPESDAVSKYELANETGYSEEVVTKALRHLIDMGYMGTSPKWNYRLGTKGREKKEELCG